MTSIITHEIEERYPYPDNGERPVTQTRLGACLASRKAFLLYHPKWRAERRHRKAPA